MASRRGRSSVTMASTVTSAGAGGAERRKPLRIGRMSGTYWLALQTLACASSHSASDVKPTITASIQYCERTASS